MRPPRSRKLTPEQAMTLLDLVDAEQAAVGVLAAAIQTGAINRPDATRIVEHHDAIQADLRSLVRDLRHRAVTA